VAVSSGNQSFLRPRQKPVNSSAVNQGRESSQPSSEILADRGHADDHVKIGFTKLHKILILFIERTDRLDSCYFFNNFSFLFSREQIWDLTVVQDVADFLHHAFL